MSATPEAEHLNNLNNPHHRQTLLQVFQDPASHNIEWHVDALETNGNEV